MEAEKRSKICGIKRKCTLTSAQALEEISFDVLAKVHFRRRKVVNKKTVDITGTNIC